ncbi:MAG: peptide deformylase, partial [bacterium]|nr:peptide deformylase [bacterium]
MILKIARMGHPVLRQIAEEVEDPKSPETKKIIQDMTETLEDFGPVAGLAAPQLHISKRIIFYTFPKERADEHTPDGIPPTFLINPVIEILGEETDLGWEACLSLPDVMGEVPRYTHIRCTAFTKDGEKVSFEAKGFHARVLQHEYDHLDGILYPMRMTDMSRFGMMGEVLRYVRGQEAQEA